VKSPYKFLSEITALNNEIRENLTRENVTLTDLGSMKLKKALR